MADFVGMLKAPCKNLARGFLWFETFMKSGQYVTVVVRTAQAVQ